MSSPNTLLEVIQVVPAHSTAIILPESGIRVTYQPLRDQGRKGERGQTALPLIVRPCLGDSVLRWTGRSVPFSRMKTKESSK